jgi:transcription initiation factor TFIIH subunit 1
MATAGSVPKGSAAYKKKDGILTITADHKSVVWSPLPGTGPPVVSLTITNISSECCLLCSAVSSED